MREPEGDVPPGLRYTVEHEWLLVEGVTATVGLTDHAQDRLGDVVYVELPPPGASVRFMEKMADIESVKVAWEIYAPASGEVIETNGALSGAPELVNKDPYGEGWLIRIRLADPDEVARLLDAAAYRNLVQHEVESC